MSEHNDEAPGPAGPQDWMQGLAVRELYESYAATIRERFPAFAVRPFDEARYDMAQPLHRHRPGHPVDQLVVDAILTPESHQRFCDDLDAFVHQHELHSWCADGGSLAFLTDHGQFTDVPVLAESLGRIGLGRRETTVQVVSEMIALLGLDLGAGPIEVMELLRGISSVVQTVPRLDGEPSDELRAYRARRNADGVQVLNAARDTPGSITVASLVARHNVTSRNGRTLFIHEPNRRTLEPYESERVRVVPVFIDCPTFSDDGGWTPAEISYELFAPMRVEAARRDARTMLELMRAATERAVGHAYPHGVKIRSWAAQQAARRVHGLSSAARRRSAGGESRGDDDPPVDDELTGPHRNE